jgi:sialic acid synthase SpsE
MKKLVFLKKDVKKGQLLTTDDVTVVFDEVNWDALKIRWWERIILFFIRKRIAMDFGKDADYSIFYKVFNGKIYIVKDKVTRPSS